MRLITATHLDMTVLHLVAPHGGRGLVLSEAVLDTSARSEVEEFLLAHVSNGIEDVQSRAADFIVTGQDRPAELCEELLACGRSDFVVKSQKLARQLHDVIRNDRRISDGTLAVLRFVGRRNEVDKPYIALLKLDPSEQFRTITTEDDQGRQIVSLDVEGDILPSVRERLQKSAFVRSISDRGESGDGPDYRILLLDRQSSGTPARFFVEDFLGAEFVLDNTERTHRLYKTLRRKRNEIEDELDAEDLRALDETIRTAFAGRIVDLDVFTRALPVDESQRRQFDAALREELPDREFEIDQEAARRFVRKRTFEGDHGLRVTLDADAFDQMVAMRDIEGTTPPVRLITIRTREWKEK